MKIEHIALYVKDLETARNFFVKYLGAKSNEGYHNLNKILHVKMFGHNEALEDYLQTLAV